MGIGENRPRLRRSGFLIGEIILYFTINFSIFLLNFERRIASETLASSRKFKVQIQGTPLDFRGY